MGKILKLGLTLMIIAAISGVALAFVYNVTEPIIAGRQAAEVQEGLCGAMDCASNFVLLDEEEMAPLRLESNKFSAIKEVYAAYSDYGFEGYIFLLTTVGYGGDISLLVGVSKDEIVSGLDVMSHSETAGLGSKITNEEFTSQFIGAINDSNLKTEAEGGTISAITRATISTNATIKGVKLAIEAANALLAML